MKMEDIVWKKLNEPQDGEMIDSWKPKINDVVGGKYVGKKEDIGRYHKNLYTLEQLDGEKIAVWGSTQIDREFAKAKLGDFIKIVYLGKINNPKTGNNFHSYDVYIGALPKKKETSAKKSGDDIPF